MDKSTDSHSGIIESHRLPTVGTDIRKDYLQSFATIEGEQINMAETGSGHVRSCTVQ